VRTTVCDDKRQLFVLLFVTVVRANFASPTGSSVVTLLFFFLIFLDVPRSSRIQSPEGSTLSICGDSQLEELSLDESCSSLPGTSRDDGSELSFYRRFVEDHAVCVTHTRRSREILRQGITSNTVSLEEQCERSVSDSKLKKPTYRPYTIEEYRSLSVPRPDRSLGPDKDEVQAKVCFCDK